MIERNHTLLHFITRIKKLTSIIIIGANSTVIPATPIIWHITESSLLSLKNTFYFLYVDN